MIKVFKVKYFVILCYFNFIFILYSLIKWFVLIVFNQLRHILIGSNTIKHQNFKLDWNLNRGTQALLGIKVDLCLLYCYYLKLNPLNFK